MAYKQYAIADLAKFSGRPVGSYTSFATDSAIPQALLLFKIGTCLASPDALTEVEKELVDMAIITMADSIYLSQPFMAVAASPFNSETIGSYSYSKVAKMVAAGAPTGVMWFDLAITQVSICSELAGGDIMFGGVEVFEHSETFIAGNLGHNIRFLSPTERSYHDLLWAGLDPAPLSNPVPASGLPVLGDDELPPLSGGLVEDPDNPGLFYQP